MTTPFIVVKSHKSTGIAVLLTFLFGPLGLFYASVMGGLIMTFSPVILLVFLLVGYFKESSLILGWSFVLLITFGLTYWLICIIWAIISVRTYNKEIEDDAKRQLDLWNRHHERDQNKFVVNINQKSSDINTSGQGTIEASTKPKLTDWLKNNPGMTINDYFTKFGR